MYCMAFFRWSLNGRSRELEGKNRLGREVYPTLYHLALRLTKLKLNIAERFALLGVLPQQGNAITLRIIRELQSRLSFTEEELKHYNIQNHANPDGSARVTWNPELSEEETDIPIGEAVTGVIKGELTKLNATNQLHVTMLPLYEKFVEDIK